MPGTPREQLGQAVQAVIEARALVAGKDTPEHRALLADAIQAVQAVIEARALVAGKDTPEHRALLADAIQVRDMALDALPRDQHA